MSSKITIKITPSQSSMLRKLLLSYVQYILEVQKKSILSRDFRKKELEDIYGILKQM